MDMLPALRFRDERPNVERIRALLAAARQSRPRLPFALDTGQIAARAGRRRCVISFQTINHRR
ncbi:MAG TPA: hypothetical protein VF132_04625 [Rudaea sp.]